MKQNMFRQTLSEPVMFDLLCLDYIIASQAIKKITWNVSFISLFHLKSPRWLERPVFCCRSCNISLSRSLCKSLCSRCGKQDGNPSLRDTTLQVMLFSHLHQNAIEFFLVPLFKTERMHHYPGKDAIHSLSLTHLSVSKKQQIQKSANS